MIYARKIRVGDPRKLGNSPSAALTLSQLSSLSSRGPTWVCLTGIRRVWQIRYSKMPLPWEKGDKKDGWGCVFTCPAAHN